jgi:hypothetical protein
VNSLREQWVEQCVEWCATPADFYSGCRKILRNKTATFNLDDSLQLSDAGYTKSKMTMLTKNYLHEESVAMAVRLWDLRRAQAKYGSVSFTTFNHFVKGKGTLDDILDKKSKRASVFGPCIQSVAITWISKKSAAVDVFYRTTEALKKLAPDLVFIRDVLLAPFKFDGLEVTVTLHFANVTVHPMYFVTIIPLLKNPIADLEFLKGEDKFFFEWCVKWSARYICEEHMRGIQKFSQALRVKKDADDRMSEKVKVRLRAYLRKNHPGHRNAYVDPDLEDDE